MIWLEPENWERTKLLEKYLEYDFPYINLGAEIDITKLYHFSKKHDLSFYCAMIHTVTKTALEIKNFKYRFWNGKPLICESLSPVFTYLPKGEEQFYLVNCPFDEDIIHFCRQAQDKAVLIGQSGKHEYGIAPDDMEILYISCIPWVHYTHFVRTVKIGGIDNIPRISWGKYITNPDGRMTMPVSVQVHHGLMDGYHVGIFFEKLEELLNSIH